ncbi:MAG: HNH endonuclease [Neisseria sp.]|uniref:HNH endonuclease n=1 Tax=Neisseria sp. TaxID=192066 RepID=UPI0026DB3D6C|nr:HNH endonuclease [Neisseria sp.]MDO4247436.1 HNH endonuclease [Neisseria sp.]
MPAEVVGEGSVGGVCGRVVWGINNIFYNSELKMKCFLCEKDNVEMSLEHSIPQFLGGKKSDDKFKKLNLCRACNSGLGTHVDARFARSFINAMELNEINDEVFFCRFTSIVFEDDDEIHDLISENSHIEMMSNDKSFAFWVKENTEEFLGLVGGHAPLSKSKKSQLFLFLTKELDKEEIQQLLKNIIIKFKDYKKLEILLCIDFLCDSISGEKQLVLYREQIKNELGVRNLKFIWEFTEQEAKIKERLSPSAAKNSNGFKSSLLIDLNDYVRFLSKLYLGVLCGFLGSKFVHHNISTKLIEIIRTYSSKSVLPDYDMGRFKMRLKSGENSFFLSENNAIVIAIFQIEKDVMGYLSINCSEFVLKICEHKDLPEEARQRLYIGSACCKIPEGVGLILKSDAEKYEEFDVKKFLLSKTIKEKFPHISEEQKKEIFKCVSGQLENVGFV